MNQVVLNLAYRPIKLAWCIKLDDFESLKKALRFSHSLWGGRFNPIIISDAPSFSNQIIDQYRPDFLFELNPDDSMNRFVDSHVELPFIRDEEWESLWHDSGLGKADSASFANICSILKRHKYQQGDLLPVNLEWSPEDPLTNIFSATFGELPSSKDTNIDYKKWFTRDQRAYEEMIKPNEVLGLHLYHPEQLTLNRITTLELEPQFQQTVHSSYALRGLYIGDPSSFLDTIYYWNLRAAGLELVFLPICNSERLKEATLHFLRTDDLTSKSKVRNFSIWHQERNINEINEAINPLNMSVENFAHLIDLKATYVDRQSNIIVPTFSSKQTSIIAPVLDSERGPYLQILMPPSPLEEHESFQKVMLSIGVQTNEVVSAEHTFKYPNLPRLNEFYGLNLTDSRLNWWRIRVQKHGIDFVMYQWDKTLILNAVKQQLILKEIFRQSEIDFNLSHAGLLVTRMLDQLGGLGWMRLFKIPSVRTLIERHAPEKWFSHSEAMSLLSGTDIGKPLKKQNIRIGSEKLLTSALVLRTLLERTILRIGMELKCPFCDLNFWISLDRLKTKSECSLCGKIFSVTSQISHQNWSYKTSGIFAYRKDQGGAIPVALAMSKILSYLFTTLEIQSRIMSWSANLTFLTDSEPKCETDLACLVVRDNGVCELLLAECKGGKNIQESDLQNLLDIADRLERSGIVVYILFSKLCPFLPEEIAFISEKSDLHDPRIILLSNDELESPYWMTEARVVSKEPDSRQMDFHKLAMKSYKKHIHNVQKGPESD